MAVAESTRESAHWALDYKPFRAFVLTGQHPARMAERDIQQAHQCPTTHLMLWASTHPGQAEQVERAVVAVVEVTWVERGYAHIARLSMRVLDPIVRFVDCRLVGEVKSAGGRVGYSQYIHHMVQPHEHVGCGMMTYTVTSHRNKCPTSKYSTPSLHQVCSPAAPRNTAKIVC